MQTFKTL